MLSLFIPFLLHASSEIIHSDSGKQIASIIKDIEIEDMLSKTKEFAACRDKNKFESGLSSEKKTEKIQAAEECFQKELGKGAKNLKQLEELSEKLNLQHYGLVQSKSIKDMQKYLNDKMYKAMTGVDPNEKNEQKIKDDLKFGKRKHIDQAKFIQMYKTQLGKNALFEVSRFCFENLRKNTSSPGQNFVDHWAAYTPGSLKVRELNDSGEPRFGSFQDTSNKDKDKVYQEIFKSIQGADGKVMDSTLLSNFFFDCGKIIVPLCEVFEDSIKLGKDEKTESQVDAKKDSSGKSIVSNGAAACLAKSRIQEYRRTMLNVEKIAEQFGEMKNDDKSLKILIAGMNGEAVKFFGDGKDPNEETIDDLTNNTSSDIIEGGYTSDEQAEKNAEECEKKPELAECESFISQSDSLEKAKHSIEMELTLKREVEVARIKRIIEDKKDLKKYLQDHGYIQILKEHEASRLKEEDIPELVGKSFEAKKRSMLEQINAKLGKRQISKSVKDPQIDQESVKEVIQETKEERARLAQVVLFNNIITSHISLKKKDGKDAGRNVNVWKKEEQALISSKIKPELFENLKASNADATGIGKDAQISDFKILDTLLGE